MRSHYTLAKMTKVKKTDNIKCWQDYGTTGITLLLDVLIDLNSLKIVW